MVTGSHRHDENKTVDVRWQADKLTSDQIGASGNMARHSILGEHGRRRRLDIVSPRSSKRRTEYIAVVHCCIAGIEDRGSSRAAEQQIYRRRGFEAIEAWLMTVGSMRDVWTARICCTGIIWCRSAAQRPRRSVTEDSARRCSRRSKVNLYQEAEVLSQRVERVKVMHEWRCEVEGTSVDEREVIRTRLAISKRSCQESAGERCR